MTFRKQIKIYIDFLKIICITSFSAIILIKAKTEGTHMNNNNFNQTDAIEPSDIIIRMLTVITMLEKALERKARQNYYYPNQYPAVYFEIQSALITLRTWIETYRGFCQAGTFNTTVALSLETIGKLVADFIITSCPVKGKKQGKKSRLVNEHERIDRTIKGMLEHIQAYLEQLKLTETTVGIEIEKALFKAFEVHCSQEHEKKAIILTSKRGEKTYIFPYSNKLRYIELINDRKAFMDQVVKNIGQLCQATGHKNGCKGEKGYQLRGFRPIPRKTIVEGGNQEVFPIRMVECKGCGQKFSILPSFLPREKHFGIDIIGNILRGILLSAHSLRSAFESIKLTGHALKSKQTILNWIAWIGTHHPATLLTRAGIKSSGYFQEDEAFEKEPDLRTYTVTMVECDTLLVWHLDYVDRVDEATLVNSFEKFVEQIDFSVLGVTKDKWKASTNALKTVFYRVWIGFCHRHCLKKFRQALSEYQKQTKCSIKEVKRLYEKFCKILATSTSKVNLEVKIDMAKETAFDHPSIHPIIKEVKKNAVHYTAHKKRSGIKKTTSLVDNFLKIVKRKLKQVESFRDRHWTAMLFRAMANARNFVPFMSGAKNAHKSPFMLANGKTYDLPWIQVMNMHNAFLFADV